MSKVIAILAAVCLCAIAAADTGAPAMSSKATPSSFATLDKNADNRISKTEAGVDRALSNRFAYIDTNGDGFISRTEYLAQNETTRDPS